MGSISTETYTSELHVILCFTICVHSAMRRNIQIIINFVLTVVRGEPEVSSTEITASEQLQPTPSTAVVSGKRQRDEPQVTERYAGHIDSDLHVCI